MRPQSEKIEPRGEQKCAKGNQKGAKRCANGSPNGTKRQPKGDQNASKNRPAEKVAKMEPKERVHLVAFGSILGVIFHQKCIQ